MGLLDVSVRRGLNRRMGRRWIRNTAGAGLEENDVREELWTLTSRRQFAWSAEVVMEKKKDEFALVDDN